MLHHCAFLSRQGGESCIRLAPSGGTSKVLVIACSGGLVRPRHGCVGAQAHKGARSLLLLRSPPAARPVRPPQAPPTPALLSRVKLRVGRSAQTFGRRRRHSPWRPVVLECPSIDTSADDSRIASRDRRPPRRGRARHETRSRPGQSPHLTSHRWTVNA